MALFNKIKAGSEQYKAAANLFDSLADRFDYDGLAAEYNTLEKDEMLQFEYKKGKGAVVRQQLEKRGLKNSEDFSVRSAAKEGSEDISVIIVKRLSDKATGPVERAARKTSEGGGAAPATDSAAAAAPTPAKSGKAK